MADAGDVARARRIADRLVAWDVDVRELPGWEQLGATWTRVPRGIINHHDASTLKSGELGALGIVRYGRPDLGPPLSQWFTPRCLTGTPVVYLVAAGRANHAGRGGPYGPVPRDAGNSWLMGTEKANNGLGEPYTEAHLYAATALYAACAEVCGFPPGMVLEHKEWAPGRKSDSAYEGAWMRERVRTFRPGWSGGVDVEAPPTIRRGSADRRSVLKLQALLAIPHGHPEVRTDGTFDDDLDRVVREHQDFHGLDVDGICGPATWRTLVLK